MSAQVNWGVLGTGAIAKAFAHGLKQSNTGKLFAVGSRSQESADKFGNEHGVERRYGSYEALLADPQVQAVYVCTPHPLHAQWAIRAIEAGKHVLLEKPFAVNQWEAMAVVDAAKVHKRLVMEAFMYRCHPQTAKLVELIGQKLIGEVRVISATFSFQAGFNPEGRLFKNSLAGGGIMDVGCYTVSISRLIAGAALGKPFADPVDVKGAAHLGQTGVDEWAIGTLMFEAPHGAILAQIATGVGVQQDNTLRIYGSEGRIMVPNPFVANRQNSDSGKIIVQPKGKEAQEIVIEAPATSFALEADFAGEAILAGRLEASPPAMTPMDTLGNMRTLDRWRDAVGLQYEMEKLSFNVPPVDGLPLMKKADAPMKYGRIEGLHKDVSRLVMGVDNQSSIAQATVMFDDYFRRGGNTFDTAFIYGGGTCEKVLGQWVNNRGLREQVVILGKGAHTPFCTPNDLTAQLLQSLERLQTDHLDIYMMHRDNPDVPVGEFMDVLNEHVKAGRIKIFGGSNWSIERLQRAQSYANRKGLQGFSAVSNNFSLARMVKPVWDGCIALSDEAGRKWLKKTQMPLLPWSSQARGFFTERATLDTKDHSLKNSWYSEDNWQRRERAVQLAEELGVQPIQVALAYVLCQPFPTFPLIGPRTLEETRSSLGALAIELTPKQVKWLNLETDKK